MKTTDDKYLTGHDGTMSTDIADARVFYSIDGAMACANNIRGKSDERITVEPTKQGYIVISSKKHKCICRLGPGHSLPNRESYVLDHRCLAHGERKLPQVWGRHETLELHIDVSVYNALVRDTSGIQVWVNSAKELTTREVEAKVFESYIAVVEAIVDTMDTIPNREELGTTLHIRPCPKGFTVSYTLGEQE